MALFIYADGPDYAGQIRLGSGFSIQEAAELGAVGTGTIEIDDVAGSVTARELRACYGIETACSTQRLFSAFLADNATVRADSLLLGVMRRRKYQTVDLNASLGFRVLHGSDANRPAETDIERITWWLGSGFNANVYDEGFIDTSNPRNMDATDYRGRFGEDLFQDCAQNTGKNYFVAYDEPSGKPAIHYYEATAAINSSSMKISNVLADVDESTVYAPSKDAQLERDPSQVYSGVLLQYTGGSNQTTGFVYEEDPTTATNYAARDTVVTADSTISSESNATQKADKMLAAYADARDRITCVLRKVPKAQVNLIRAGQRIQVKFSHFPPNTDGTDYTSYTWIRIVRRTVQQSVGIGGVADLNHYDLQLELQNIRIGYRLRHGPPTGPGPNPTPVDDATMTIFVKQATYESGGTPTFSVDDVPSINPVMVALETYENIAYTDPNCNSTVLESPFGCYVGIRQWEAWYGFLHTLSDEEFGAVVAVGGTVVGHSFGILNPAHLNGNLMIGVASSLPTGINQFIELGTVPADTGGEVFLPRNYIQDGLTTWIVVAPAWILGNTAVLLADWLATPTIGPAGGTGSLGENNSGRAEHSAEAGTPNITVTTRKLQGTGLTPWIPGDGAVDGVNATFTLNDWDGTGVPEVKLGGVVLALEDYTYDATAKTVTFLVPPPDVNPGVVPYFRYNKGV